MCQVSGAVRMLVSQLTKPFEKVHIIACVIFSDLPGAIMLNKLKWQTHLHCKVVVFFVELLEAN